MGDCFIIDNLGELMKFANEKGAVEIAMRGAKKRFSAFHKVILNNIPQGSSTGPINDVLAQMSKVLGSTKKFGSMLSKINKISGINLIFSSANLCATCAGFAIMYSKLDKMSSQISQLMSVVKQGYEVQADYEFKKVISEHSNMLDSRKTRKFYNEEKMRKLVDDEYNVLNMLTDVFVRGLAEDSENLIFSIFSLASMLAVSIKYFDELYYFENKEAIGDGDKWHSSHEKWMSAFARLYDKEFIKKLQDHGVFDLNLSLSETDTYYVSLSEQVKDLELDVKDNQELIEIIDNSEQIAELEAAINKLTVQNIQKIFEETPGAMQDQDAVNACQETLKQLALA